MSRTNEEWEEALSTIEDKYAELVDKLEDTQIALADKEGCLGLEDMVEQECRRCHKVFTGHPDQRYCIRDCQHGFTPAPTYEQWYASMHPRSPWITPTYTFKDHEPYKLT